MPKIAKELSALEVKRLNTPGWHAVGGVAGLLLQIRPPTQPAAAMPRSWILRMRIGGQRQPVGLGSYPQVSLAEARDQAKKLSAEAKSGVNLVAKKRAQRSSMIAAATKNKTFKECAEAYMEAHASDYTNDKHRKQWASTLESYAYPVLGRILVSDISMRHVLDVLMQDTKHRNGDKGKLWHIKAETAKRLLDRIRTVLDYATVNEYRSGNNPATWKGYLDTQLPAPRGLKQTKHQPAVPYTLVGDFMSKLRSNNSTSARALEFLVLTAVRSGSVRSATWDEIDLDKKLWTIPAAHTKAKREHKVPLPNQAVSLLSNLPKMAGTALLFPNPKGKVLSDMALSQLMRGMRERGELPIEGVPHGFRSTFRDWAAEQTNYPDEIRKAASGHAVGDAVKEAYQRTDLLEKRRHLMTEWASFLDLSSGGYSSSVTPIRAKA
ncbi:tyrosine-type recombinase/integrase [Limnohabitans sp. Rim8]|uniref:tyrosine-type recombinase/integrase n=1 Tax=Limnohabitans sp. Rim8 TaxID=1100718 RepID=UPI003306430E